GRHAPAEPYRDRPGSRRRARPVRQPGAGSVERRIPSPRPFEFGADRRGTGGNGRERVRLPRGGPCRDLRRPLAGRLGASREEALSLDLTPREEFERLSSRAAVLTTV